jgi:hypothetical protein
MVIWPTDLFSEKLEPRVPSEFKWTEPLQDRAYRARLDEIQQERVLLLSRKHERFDRAQAEQELEKLRSSLSQTLSEKQDTASELHRTQEELQKWKNELYTLQRQFSIVVTNQTREPELKSQPPAATSDIVSETSPVDPKSARGLIETIRAEKTLPFPNRHALCGCIDNLGGTLYPSPSHFVQELMQNSDDCIYEPETCPELAITIFQLENPGFLFCSNEVGFKPENVEAICSISESTKRNGGVSSTGEKGLGFKSVFEVTHRPAIISGEFSFYFDSSDPEKDSMEKYLLPCW